MNARLVSLFLLLGLTLATAFGQSTTITLTGRVLDAATNQPVPFANVYLNASTQGTTADAQGNYQLTGLPTGTSELVASALGFVTSRQTLRLTTDRALQLSLKPESKALQTITVTARRTRAYDRMVRVFERELLGNTSFANRCQIKNMDAVVLTSQDGKLTARASEPLLIENLALGYRVYYSLLHFDHHRGATYYAGTSRFELLTPDNTEQAQRWEKNRQKAYQGSLRHLLTSLVAGTYEKEGFLVYEANFAVPANPSVPVMQRSERMPTVPAQADSIIKPASLATERLLRSIKPLEVFYTRQRAGSTTPYKEMPYAYSLVYLPKGKAALVTTDGWVAQPNGLEIRGAMSDDRLSNLLPADWKPATVSPAQTIALPTEDGTLLPLDTISREVAKRWTNQQQNSAPTVFVQTDKGLYLSGDTLWFSSYILDPQTHEPVTQLAGDNPLHLELLSPSGRVLSHQWVRVQEGRGAGWLRVPDSLATGTYRLQAYSESDRRNARPAFERNMTIVATNPDDSTLASSRSATNERTIPDSLDVQFLPEGGHWVAGLPSRLGIKTINKQGQGVATTGRLVSQAGTELGRFSTNRLGFGSVDVTPQAGTTYRAVVTTGADLAQSVTLPTVEPNGLVLATDMVTDSTQLRLKIQASAPLAQQPVYLTIQSRGQLVQQTKLQLQSGKASLTIPTAKLPVGLAQVTLYNAQGQPQQERLVFIPDRQLPVQARLITDKSTYLPRETVQLAVRVADGFDEPLTITGSATVTDESQLPADSASANIRTHLLLTGELKGQVEEANQYVTTGGKASRKSLDDLLLTQGWRRFTWQTPATQPELANELASLQGQRISGYVIDKNEKPIPASVVLLTFSSPRGESFARSARADQFGHFTIDGLSMTDTMYLRPQVTTATFKPISTAQIRLDQPGGYFSTKSSEPSSLPDLTPFLMASQQRQISAADRYRDRSARQLGEVTVRATNMDAARQAQQNAIYGKADVTVLFDEKSRAYGNAYEMLAAQLSGVQVRPNTADAGGGYLVTVRGISMLSAKARLKEMSPLYMIDGTYLTENKEGNALMMLNPTQIERIDLIKNEGASVFGARGANGVIAFYSKKARFAQTGANANQTDLLVHGYPSERTFYVPKYGRLSESGSALPDRRNVLYWRPLLATDKTGITSFRIPLSDTASVLRVTVQGVTSDGRPVAVSQLLKVR
ncbi:carboxypeptidase-like regulatory domain-containing protein [Spirosoma sp. KUDC1026]|uniref:carboxypeptidase-like regulatory domain-containing protein n=1 Tax=Spirosoma sp. KUDC1026 TaxID=2745947 RepID=UPI00159B93AE|nr:carboxypeptidase-like regulatory domain-containing protein [Spirosoma sp. KUDC1026]QKZ13151.1 carboxypeptidase-like regulatory domain-containing protein [Spirosoma sp. KUDC1026]